MLLNNRYKIIRTLGSGGFGETFLAEDTQIPSQRRCVIKQLKPIEDNPQVYQLVQQRFQREAAILEELGDGNNQIPRLYAYFSIDGQFYLVQEYIEGQTLSAKLQSQGFMSESGVKEILTGILPVLEYVHSKGIVHRDIKPDNILVRYSDGKPVLIDFGAVKEIVGTVMTPSGNSTRSIVIGTPGFMSSEQSVGRPMFASDIYSLGLTGIYLLTGKIPQELQTDPATGMLLWRQHTPNITPSFASILDKAIQFQARDRFNTVGEMLQVLHSGTSQVSPTVPHPGMDATVPYYSQTPATVPPSQPPQDRLPVSSNSASPIPSSSSPPTVNQGGGNGQKGILIGSIIIGSIVGASVIFGLTLKRPTVQVTENHVDHRDNSYDSKTNKTPRESQDNQSTNVGQKVRPKPIYPPKLSPPIAPPAKRRPSPAKAIRNYFQIINQGEYETAWNRLTPELRQNEKLHPNGYKSYTDWWGEKVERVEIDSVNIVKKSAKTATVDIQLQYRLKNGKKSSGSVSFSLSWNAENNRWMIADAQ
ncbi:MAG: serine/threonine-protein kinase [Nostocaceae cyanobacterium]|nr:serine/threonine-protein kinase [Nostocaceae cyanobacterium]